MRLEAYPLPFVAFPLLPSFPLLSPHCCHPLLAHASSASAPALPVTMSRIYRYVPVSSPRHTRVLRLEPSPDAASPLRCSLSEVSLDALEDPSTGYTALSYTWDAQSPSQIVECDGGTLHVTANCEAAMRRLRRPDETHALWIDSICIDQSAAAIDERSAQVAVMGEVYMKAKQVVVWLGESDEKFEVFLRHLAEILGALRMPSSPGRFTNITELRDIMLGILKEKVQAIARRKSINQSLATAENRKRA